MITMMYGKNGEKLYNPTFWETFVGGIDGHREWMVQVITCDLNGGKRRDYSWFFNTRKEAEDHLAKILENQKACNLIVKIVKIKAYNFMSIDQF